MKSKNRNSLIKKFLLIFTGLSAGVGIYHWIFFQMVNFFQPFWQTVVLRTPASLESPQLLPHLVRPLGMIAVAGFCLSLEWILVGTKKSAFAALTNWSDPSVKTDWFCFVVLSLMGLRSVFAALLSIGLTLGIQSLAGHYFHWNLISEFPIWGQLCILLMLNPFIFYCNHRIMHAWFWDIHKVHHSATSMTILTPHRNHPVDFIVVTVCNTVPAALLGCSFFSIAIYELLNGIYQSMVHSNAHWKSPWIDKFLLISPEAHRIHHSNNPEHFDKNFGVVVFWDWLFGTQLKPSDTEEPKEIGFHEDGLHNSGHPFLEMFQVLKMWFLRPKV